MILLILHMLIPNQNIFSPHRRLELTNLEDQARLEHLYICIELYNRICFVWVKFAWPPIIFCSSLMIIIPTFVSIRYTDLPVFCFIAFPTTAITIMVVLFWVFYEIVCNTRDSEDILGQLRSQEAPFLREIPIAMRMRAFKRAKAMRAIEFPVGTFADFSITVPVAVWDEIVNDVVFLLTL